MDEPRCKRLTLPPRQRNRRVHPLIAPSFDALAIERGVSRPAKGRTPPPAHAALADVVIDRDEVPGGGRRSDHPLDFCGKTWCHPLVGIDFEDPFAAAG